MPCEMANETLLSRRGELGSQGSSKSEAEATPALPEARLDVIGVRVDNPAWRRYMRFYDVWEGDDDAN